MEIKNKLVQCPNGHYYNGAIHNACPICSGQNSHANVGATVAAGSAQVGGTIPAGDGLNRTVPAGDGQVIGGTIPAGDGGNMFPPTVPPDAAGLRGNFFDPTIPPDDGKDFDATQIGEEDDETGGNLDPVVGWLVCIEGGCKGQDFKIRAGYNYIGRESGDIVIPGDNHISRQNHAMIAYDSSDDIYYVGPSAGRNLIKVNGRTLFNASEIRSYDVISIGTTKLMFIALCSERFNWNRGRVNG